MCPAGEPRPKSWFVLTCLLAGLGLTAWARASTITLKDGRRLEGAIGQTTGLADNPLANKSGEALTIVFVDNDLRRVFVPWGQVRSVDEVHSGEIPLRIKVGQQVARNGSRISRVGPIVKTTQFDEFGRRIVTMLTNQGPMDVIQGITRITPVYTQVEGLLTKQLTPLVWDMRIATSSIPRETLRAILMSSTDRQDINSRLRVVQLLLQSERYRDARRELEEVIADFPNSDHLEREVQALQQLHARSIVKEIDVRRAASQHHLAYTLLEQFPTKGVAGEILQQVSERLAEYREIQEKFKRMDAALEAHVKALPGGRNQERCEALLEEMRREAGIASLDRLAAYLRLSDDESLGHEQKLSLAYSGWLLGADYAATNLAVTLSLAEVRDIVHRYMNEPVKLKRDQLLTQLQKQEGAAPALVARLIAHMKPPLETPEPSVATPGHYQLSVPIGIEHEPDVSYYVQLPPEYNPYVRYPTIVALNGAGFTPQHEIDWWAGAQNDEAQRLGQATRLGYIVVAVDWLKQGQSEYGFSAREHAAVLASLRDACRRFSIDTDRVFLSGHSTGGDAVWDLGLAHPDLWAGVIPIVAQARKYCARYWQNAKLVPFYVVQGELDGDKVKDNAPHLDRYMTHRFDVTVVEYRGRGHEDFYEDIQHIFDWMALRESRNFFPKEFEVSTMRSWDNFFWWLEVTKLPERTMVEPSDWPPARGVRAASLRAKVLASGDIYVSSGRIRPTIWVSPGLVDPSRDSVEVNVAGRRMNVKVKPELGTLLEDVRTRADRQHPFWAKIEP